MARRATSAMSRVSETQHGADRHGRPVSGAQTRLSEGGRVCRTCRRAVLSDDYRCEEWSLRGRCKIGPSLREPTNASVRGVRTRGSHTRGSHTPVGSRTHGSRTGGSRTSTRGCRRKPRRSSSDMRQGSSVRHSNARHQHRHRNAGHRHRHRNADTDTAIVTSDTAIVTPATATAIVTPDTATAIVTPDTDTATATAATDKRYDTGSGVASSGRAQRLPVPTPIQDMWRVECPPGQSPQLAWSSWVRLLQFRKRLRDSSVRMAAC